MSRCMFVLTLFAILIDVAPSISAVYTGGAAVAGPAAIPELQPGSAFPRNVLSDAAYLSGGSNGLSTVLAAVNEFFTDVAAEQRPVTVASLYGNLLDLRARPAPAGTEDTIPVRIGGFVSAQGSINVITGANTSGILSQLFSGLINVENVSFGHRSNRGGSRGANFGSSGSSAGHISTGQMGGFSSLHRVGGARVAGGSWLGGSSLSTAFPAFKEEKKPVKPSDGVYLVLRLLNPYFYGGLLIILLFSFAWSMRSRFMLDEDGEP